ncbi:MAG: pseudouridine synthase [Candidatus Hodgkinia cicadicola]
MPQALASSYCLNFRSVHRLDAGTFGLLIICKSRRGFGELSCQFNRKLVLKLYVCLCVGPSPGFVGSRGCVFGSRLKLTTWFCEIQAVVCKLVAGRTHLIRGSQRCVWGDRTYANRWLLAGVLRALRLATSQHSLNAYLVCFEHAVNRRLVSLEHKPDVFSRYLLINFLKFSASGVHRLATSLVSLASV